MSAANGVASGIYVLWKLCVVMTLNVVHPFSVKFFNALPNFSIILVIVSKSVLWPPMTKVSWKNEKSLLVVKVRCKDLTILFRHLLINRTSHDGYYFDFTSQGFVDQRQMHLDTMFVLLIIDVDHMKSLFSFKLLHYFNVHL
jgi:hypothetical protein